MTGPEHYREAERLAELAGELEEHSLLARRALERAQVHATLALAAATALGYDHVPTRDYQIWLAAAGTPQEAAP